MATPFPVPPPDPAIQRVLAAINHLPDLVNGDANLVRRGRYLTADIQLVLGPQTCFLSIFEGQITVVEAKPQIMRPAAFRIAAEIPAWLRFWRKMPEPGWHDILAMMKRGHLTVDGDLRVFMGHLQYIKDVIALPRKFLGGD
jgi:hypothetical protein